MSILNNKIATMSLFFIFLAFSHFSFAAEVPQDNNIDNIIQIYRNSTQIWEPIIRSLTLGLFWGLVTISFTWSSSQIALKGGGLVDVLADLTTRVLTVGFAVWLINVAPDLARSLIESFHEIGSRLSGEQVNFSPSNVVELASNIVSSVWKQASIGDPLQALMFFVTALIILICFALVAMEMTILIVSSYIIVSGGIVMMGFLGSEWTKEHAMNYFTAVLGVATKMFVQQLILILGYGFIHDFMTNMSQQSPDTAYLALLIVAIVFCGLIREIPQIAASLASGRFTMAGGGMQAAIGAAAGVVAGAAVAATGMGVAGYDAGKSYLSESDVADNETATLKRSLDTGSGNKGSSGGTGGGSGGGGDGNTSSRSSSPATSPYSSPASSPFASPAPANDESPVETGLAGLEASNASGGAPNDYKEKGGSDNPSSSTTESPLSPNDEPASHSPSPAPDGQEGSEPSVTATNTAGTRATDTPPAIPESPTTGQRIMGAAGAGLKAAGKTGVKIAKASAVSAVSSVARQSSIGAALANAGFDLMKLDDPKKTQAAHKALMADINADLAKDDGNSPYNYRDTLKEEEEEHERDA